MYHRSTLQNGVRIVTRPMADMQSVSLGLWLNVGGRHETTENKGISHYLEHMLFKGTKKYSCRKLKESIEGVGGMLNGFTSEEFTCYLVKMPAQYAKRAFDILSDMVLRPALDEKEVEKERTVILEEIKMYRDMPQSHVYEILDEMMWPRQPLGLSIAGSHETVTGITREGLAAYQQAHYTAPNLVISASGKLTHSSIERFAKEIFRSKTKHERNNFVKARESQSAPQLSIFNKATEQSHLALGFHGFHRDHPDRYALALLHIILGANMSSRLFNEVREKKGLAYEIGTAVKFFHDTGAFLVHAGIDNTKVSPTVQVIMAELSRIRKQLVLVDELRRARDFFLGQLMLGLEDTMDSMLWLGESVSALDKVYSPQEVTRKVKSVSREDIRRVAQAVFKNAAINLSLIGPLAQKESEIRSCLEIA